jgi:hypothetical protein
MMHSCCCIGFIEWCGFTFICFGFKNLFKWFGKQIHIKKRRRKSLTVLLATWRPARTGLLLLSRGWAEPSCVLLSAPRGLAQEATAMRPSLPCFADD